MSPDVTDGCGSIGRSQLDLEEELHQFVIFRIQKWKDGEQIDVYHQGYEPPLLQQDFSYNQFQLPNVGTADSVF